MTEDINPPPKPLGGAFLIDLDILEQVYSVPVNEREALLLQLVAEKKATFLGSTDKTAPELATDLIKKGIRAKSIIAGKKKVDKSS